MTRTEAATLSTEALRAEMLALQRSINALAALVGERAPYGPKPRSRSTERSLREARAELRTVIEELESRGPLF
jgi:hypothetical protein